MTRDDTLLSEVLWTLKMNTSHFRYRLPEDMLNIFCTMFPDSAIVTPWLLAIRDVRLTDAAGLTSLGGVSVGEY